MPTSSSLANNVQGEEGPVSRRFVPIRRDCQPADGTPVVVGFGGPVTNELPPEDAKDLLDQYSWVVDHVVSRIPISLMSVANLDKEDLRQEGLIALLTAAERFDRQRSARFSPFARTVVSNAIYGVLRQRDPLPESARRDWRSMTKYADEHLTYFRAEPSDDEVAAGAGLSVARIRAVRGMAVTAHAFQSSAANDVDGSDPTAAPVSEGLDEESLVSELKIGWAGLEDRDRRILWARTVEQRTIREVASQEGLSTGRVCQIQKTALERLRKLLLAALSFGASWHIATVGDIGIVSEHFL